VPPSGRWGNSRTFVGNGADPKRWPRQEFHHVSDDRALVAATSVETGRFAPDEQSVDRDDLIRLVNQLSAIDQALLLLVAAVLVRIMTVVTRPRRRLPLASPLTRARRPRQR
jgi:hypothetical protein